MSTTAIKTRILKRLAKEEDAHVLKAIDILLRDTTKEDAQRRRINEMAVRSEEAISKGDVLSLSEGRKRSKELLAQVRHDVEESLAQADRGETVSHAEAMKEVQAWRKR